MAFFDNSLIANFCASYIQSLNSAYSYSTNEDDEEYEENEDWTEEEWNKFQESVKAHGNKYKTKGPKVSLASRGISTSLDVSNVSIDLETQVLTENNSTEGGGLFSSIGGDLTSSFKGIANNFANAATTNQVQGWTTDGEVQSATATAIGNIASNFGRGELSFSSYGFSVSDYKKLLLNSSDKDFASLRNLIEDYTISAGTAFLQGNLTSAFAAGVQQVNNVQNTIRSVVNSKQIIDKAEYLIDNGADMLKTTIESCISTIATSIVRDATTNVVNMGRAMVDYAKDVPSRISQRAMSYFNTYKPDLSDILKQFIENKEEAEAKERAERQQSKLEKFVGNLDNSITNITYKINNVTGVLNDTFESVFAYSNAGLGWINDRIDNVLQEVSTSIYYITTEWQQDAKDGIDKVVNDLGEKFGGIMVEEYKNLLSEAQKKIEEQKSEKLTKALIMASTTLQTAKLKIMSMTGINIPL